MRENGRVRESRRVRESEPESEDRVARWVGWWMWWWWWWWRGLGLGGKNKANSREGGRRGEERRGVASQEKVPDFF